MTHNQADLFLRKLPPEIILRSFYMALDNGGLSMFEDPENGALMLTVTFTQMIYPGSGIDLGTDPS